MVVRGKEGRGETIGMKMVIRKGEGGVGEAARGKSENRMSEVGCLVGMMEGWMSEGKGQEERVNGR